MPDKPFQYCQGCGARVRATYCPRCKKRKEAERNSRSVERHKNDPVYKMYNCVAWYRFRESFFVRNPLCQRIDEDTKTRCYKPASVCHHLISPRVRRDLMYNYGNVKGVCAAHHATTEGEPVENLSRLDEMYVPTNIPVIRCF